MFGKVGRSPKATKLGRGIVQFGSRWRAPRRARSLPGLVTRLKTLGDNVLAVRLP